MDQLPSTILRTFYAIERLQIATDIQTAVSNPAAIHSKLREIHGRFLLEGYSPELNAAWAHVHLVQSVALHRSRGIPPEYSIYQAVRAALRVAGEGESIAMTKGRLADLLSEMSAHREAAGMVGDQDWSEESMPPAYRLLVDEFSRGMDAVHSTLLEDILRRYSLESVAELRERDELEFDILVEIGHRVALAGTKAGANFEDIDDSVDALRFTSRTWLRIKDRVSQILDEYPVISR